MIMIMTIKETPFFIFRFRFDFNLESELTLSLMRLSLPNTIIIMVIIIIIMIHEYRRLSSRSPVIISVVVIDFEIDSNLMVVMDFYFE